MEQVKGICHRCGEEKELEMCPYASEINDYYEPCCCEECGPECAWDI